MSIEIPNSGRLKGKMQLLRLQVPCSPAFSVTIHKSQGKTYDQAVVDIAKPMSPPYGSAHDNYALLYVALSRVRTLSSLEILTTFDRSVLHYRPDQRLVDELERLRLLEADYIQQVQQVGGAGVIERREV